MRITLLLAILLLGGCSATYIEPRLPADHPANVSAAAAPAPIRSRTLDLSTADPVSPAGASQGMGHEGHDADSAQPPARDAGGEHQHGAASSSAPTEPATYACPMHPEVTSDKPDQRCSKCGMELVTNQEAEQ